MKNGVWKASVDTKKWVKAAGIRAIKTMAQAAIAGIGAAAAMGQVDWGVCCVGIAPGGRLINVDVDYRIARSGKQGGINHEKCESVTSGITKKDRAAESVVSEERNYDRDL